MRSGLRRMVPRNASGNPPVPLSPGWAGPQLTALSGLRSGESLMRTFETSGTVQSVVSLFGRSTSRPSWEMFKGPRSDGRRRYTTRDEGSDQRVQLVRHPALELVKNPNPFMSRMFLFWISQVYLDLVGESYWVVDKEPLTGLPISLWPVRPDRMTPVPDPQTFLAGWVYTSPDGGQRVPLTADEVIFHRYPNPLDVYHGIGPVQAVLVDIDASRYSAEWNRNFFLNSARPDGIITAPGNLEDDEFDKLVSSWREAHRGVGRAHHVAVLEAGATYQATSPTQVDMDFVNGRNLSRDVIREAFRLHKVMLGQSDDVNRANAQTAIESFTEWEVIPRLDGWADVLNTQLLPMYGPSGAGVEFDYVRPVPTDRESDARELLSKAQAAQFLVAAGYDPADVSEVVGLPAMGVVEKATQAPALPPSWVPEQQPATGPTPGGPQSGPGNGQSDGGDMSNLLRRLLSDGYLPVETGRR